MNSEVSTRERPRGARRLREGLEAQGGRAMARFLQSRRWFGGKGRPLDQVEIVDEIALTGEASTRALIIVGVTFGRDASGVNMDRYAVPLAAVPWERLAAMGGAALVDTWGEGADREAVADASGDPSTCLALLDGIRLGRQWCGAQGRLTGRATPAGAAHLVAPVEKARLLSGEQSNTSVLFDDRLILKLIRRLERGINPDAEVLEFLATRTTYPHVPLLVGVLEYQEEGAADGGGTLVGTLQRFVSNVGDGWTYALTQLDGLLTGGAAREGESGDVHGEADAFLDDMRGLGRITGELHLALASDEEAKDFRPEPITSRDVLLWRSRLADFGTHVAADLLAAPASLRESLGLTESAVRRLIAMCQNGYDPLVLLAERQCVKIRHHGDFHLGQVLKTAGGFVVIDFEGEPARPLDERRQKGCPLRDVAGMLRSFDYAAHEAGRRLRGRTEAMAERLRAWRQSVREAFLDGYFAAVEAGAATFLPVAREEAMQIVRAFELEKAVYELRYELRNRPEWLAIPLLWIRTAIGTEEV